MLISENIPLDVEEVLREMVQWQYMPWGSGRIDNHCAFIALNRLFAIINSGIPKEDFMYQGDLFQICTPYVIDYATLDQSKERPVGTANEYGECWVLPITKYSEKVDAFSKNPDFTRPVFNSKVYHSQQAVLLHVNTGSMYGIDINAFYHRFGLENKRFEDEMEVLFPITKDTLVKEYWCTPNQFKYYMRSRC